MDAKVTLRPGKAGRTHINLSVPSGSALIALDAIQSMFALAGHKVRRVNEEGEEVFSAKAVFPEGDPAMLLRGYRGKHDMTQKALAKELGITQNRVSDMENGKRPISRDIAIKLGKLFDTPYQSFL